MRQPPQAGRDRVSEVRITTPGPPPLALHLHRPSSLAGAHAGRRYRVLASDLVDLEHVERRLRERLDALGPAPRAELLHVLMLPDFERADRIGEFWGYPESRAFAELLIDLEEDKAARARAAGRDGAAVALIQAERGWAII